MTAVTKGAYTPARAAEVQKELDTAIREGRVTAG